MIEHPACFGSPVSVSANSASCRACPGAASCVVVALKVLDQLPDSPLTRRERLALTVTRQALTSAPQGQGGNAPSRTVVANSRGVKRMTLTPDEEARLRTLPGRVASQARQLFERGWFAFAKREMLAGRNPADKGWKRVLCAQLIADGCSRADLQRAFQEQLGLKEASAKVQVSTAVAVFLAGGLVREFGGALRLSSN